MTRVVHVINGLGGGAGRLLRDVLPRLDRSTFQGEVLWLFKAGQFADELRAAGIPVRVLGVRPAVSAATGWRLAKEWRATRPDVVHAHLPEAAWQALPAARMAGVPIRVSHLHNCPWHWSWKLRAVDRLAATLATRVVACSQAVRGFHVERVRYPRSKVDVLMNAVDLTRFQHLPDRREARRQLGLPEHASILVCVGSLTVKKGHRDLLDAVRAVAGSTAGVALILVGSGPLRPELERQAEALGIRARVHFLGARDDVPLILAASDLVVSASMREGLCLALLEAGAAGRAVVAPRVGGIPEAVEDGETGLLVAPRDPGALAEAIVAAVRTPARLAEMGQRARRRIQERFSVESAVRAWEALYGRLLGGRRA